MCYKRAPHLLLGATFKALIFNRSVVIQSFRFSSVCLCVAMASRRNDFQIGRWAHSSASSRRKYANNLFSFFQVFSHLGFFASWWEMPSLTYGGSRELIIWIWLHYTTYGPRETKTSDAVEGDLYKCHIGLYQVQMNCAKKHRYPDAGKCLILVRKSITIGKWQQKHVQ